MAKISLLIFPNIAYMQSGLQLQPSVPQESKNLKSQRQKYSLFFRKPCFTESIKNQIRYSHECKRMLKIIINPIVKLFTPNGVSNAKPHRNKRSCNRYTSRKARCGRICCRCAVSCCRSRYLLIFPMHSISIWI